MVLITAAGGWWKIKVVNSAEHAPIDVLERFEANQVGKGSAELMMLVERYDNHGVVLHIRPECLFCF